MAKHQTTVTSNAAYYVATIRRRRDAWSYLATLLAFGTWGGGSLSWQLSPDAGATLLPLKDLSGNALVSNSNDSFNSQFGNTVNNNDSLQIWVTMAGATNPNVTVRIDDNN